MRDILAQAGAPLVQEEGRPYPGRLLAEVGQLIITNVKPYGENQQQDPHPSEDPCG